MPPPAIRFFLEDLYGARDFSQRNHDIVRLYELARPIAPELMIRPLILGAELHYLTDQRRDRFPPLRLYLDVRGTLLVTELER